MTYKSLIKMVQKGEQKGKRVDCLINLVTGELKVDGRSVRLTNRFMSAKKWPRSKVVEDLDTLYNIYINSVPSPNTENSVYFNPKNDISDFNLSCNRYVAQIMLEAYILGLKLSNYELIDNDSYWYYRSENSRIVILRSWL